MRHNWFLFACLMFACTSVGNVLAQSSNSTGTIMWPNNPPVGIGTQLSAPAIPQNALHIHHDPGVGTTLPAIIRLSDGSTDTTNIFATLALMPSTMGFPLLNHSNLAKPNDVVLHEAIGDLILADFDPQPHAIRMSTTPDASTLPLATPAHDLERMTILYNGNVGIDLPPDAMTNLGKPMEQVEIGGAFIPPPGDTVPTPGLTIYGGNRFEGMLNPAGGTFPVDWRYVGFNYWTNHMDSSAKRYHRLGKMSSSRIAFAPSAGGTLSFEALPYISTAGMDTFPHGFYLSLTGKHGLEIWSDEPGDPYHHLFDIWRPGDSGWVTGGLRNVNGLCMHHTPVYIGPGDSASTWYVPNFTDLANVHPDLGDGKTWMLAVNGAALFKEAYVNSEDWPDYVFEPEYKLRSLGEVERYIQANHHLPDVPPANNLKTYSIGETETATLKKVEELTLYIIELKKEIDSLKTELHDLKEGK